MAYSIERDLDSWSLYQLAWRARANLELGNWTAADEDAQAVLNNPHAAPIARIPALAALGHVRVRRGDPGIETVLDEARDRALPTGEIQRIGPAAAARAEAAWWRGDLRAVAAEVKAAYELARGQEHSPELDELAFWLWRAGELAETPPGAAGPFALQMGGDWRQAAEAWERLGCPYEQALALADGDENAQMEALEIFQKLAARPAAEFVRKRLEAVPARRLEKEKFGGLTRREREAAALIAQGKSNREIAEGMTIGVKTAETYVTRILDKLGFDSRVQIATWAVEKGLAPPTGDD
jgi:DNA-binding CsgD family transcriptional regulator